MTTISTGDFYYFASTDSIGMITTIDVRVGLTFIFGNHSSSTTTLLPEYIRNFGRYLGNVATTPASQLKNFYPELFI